ncbi:MAG TPA: hypothetical protein VFZ51_03175 [Woeseiaceae bacterium]
MKKLLLAALILSAACADPQRGMETRTYELNRLSNDEAIALITPYVREGGMVNGKNRLITVREKEDRLTLVEDMLRKYDGMGEAADVVLQIQIIEANGFTTRDSTIADIEGTLRNMFKYRGYKLVGETRVQVREGAGFEQMVGDGFTVAGRLHRLRKTGQEQRVPIEIQLHARGANLLGSTVTATLGKPVVLGQSTAGGAIILVIRPSVAP